MLTLSTVQGEARAPNSGSGPAWRVVLVKELPWPEDLFRCRWVKEFREASKAAPTTVEQRGAIACYAHQLTTAQLKECPYHRPDWSLAAGTAVELVGRGRVSSTTAAEAADQRGFDVCTASALVAFFAEPIFVDADGLGNGQHRVCAMKLAKVQYCPIES